MKTLDTFLCCLLGLFMLCVFPLNAAQAAEQAEHPELAPEERYIACSECHREATPEVYEEWNSSLHGIGMVKCYQCHGTFENFRVTPQVQNCAVCHENTEPHYPENTPCWSCHMPHSFKVKAGTVSENDGATGEKKNPVP